MTGVSRPAGPVVPARWLVSVSLPVEAGSAAEAVRDFWSYVAQLGPDELPVYVSPLGQEAVTRAYLRDEPANLDPEED